MNTSLIAIILAAALSFVSSAKEAEKGCRPCNRNHGNCPKDAATYAGFQLRKAFSAATVGPNLIQFQDGLNSDSLVSFNYFDQTQGKCVYIPPSPFMNVLLPFFQQGFQCNTIEQISSTQNKDGTVTVVARDGCNLGTLISTAIVKPIEKGSCQYKIQSIVAIDTRCA